MFASRVAAQLRNALRLRPPPELRRSISIATTIYANRRSRVNLADGSYWLYEYDNLGQVASGKRYWSDGTPVADQQFEYAHNDIGHRTWTKTGGDETTIG
jgi:hypothetical protein